MKIEKAIDNLNNYIINLTKYSGMSDDNEVVKTHRMSIAALEKQIARDPQIEPPSRTGTYLVKDRDGNYRDADWLDGKFWVKKHVSLSYEPCLIQFLVAWWPLPEVQHE